MMFMCPCVKTSLTSLQLWILKFSFIFIKKIPFTFNKQILDQKQLSNLQRPHQFVLQAGERHSPMLCGILKRTQEANHIFQMSEVIKV